MSRIDRSERVVHGDVAGVFEALIDPEALASWLPPTGMSGRFEHYDARAGGSYRMVLSYDALANVPPGGGKTTADSDVVDVRFVDIVPGERIVQAIDFDSADPLFAGTMTMTWMVESVADGTRVTVAAEDVPAGISPEDHAAGLTSSLENLASYVEAPDT